jgi:hypothetical protein
MFQRNGDRARATTSAGYGGLVWLLGLLLLSFSATGLLAQSTALEVGWWTMDGGGGTSRGAGYALHATAGQPDAGTSGGGTYRLISGFHLTNEDIIQVEEDIIYLPLVRSSR